MEVLRDEETGVVILRLNGRLDSITAPTLEHRCGRLIDEGQLRILLDMEDLDYTTSAGLRAIMAIAQRLKEQGGRFGMCRLSKVVEDVFNVSGFTLYLPVYATCQDAMRAIGEAPPPDDVSGNT